MKKIKLTFEDEMNDDGKYIAIGKDISDDHTDPNNVFVETDSLVLEGLINRILDIISNHKTSVFLKHYNEDIQYLKPPVTEMMWCVYQRHMYGDEGIWTFIEFKDTWGRYEFLINKDYEITLSVYSKLNLIMTTCKFNVQLEYVQNIQYQLIKISEYLISLRFVLNTIGVSDEQINDIMTSIVGSILTNKDINNGIHCDLVMTGVSKYIANNLNNSDPVNINHVLTSINEIIDSEFHERLDAEVQRQVNEWQMYDEMFDADDFLQNDW